MPKLSVVIPVYNEPSLASLLAKLTEVESLLKQIGIESEFIFVDDGSDSRETFEELISFKGNRENVRVARLARNFGAFHAIKTGFRFVNGDCFATLSADLQDPPELLVEMAKKWLAGTKFVICVRAGREDPLSTQLFAALYYRLIRLIAIGDFPASGYDLALMDKAFLPYLQGTSVQINYRLLAYWLGFKPEVILYKREKRIAGETHWGLGKRINLFIDSLIAFSNWPSRTIGFLGIGVTLLSAAVLTYQLTGRIGSRPDELALSLALSLISLLLGLVLSALGIVAEYLWRIYTLAANKPEVVIEEVY